MPINKISKLITAIIVCELAGVIGSIFTTPSIPTWYASLIKPDFNPPNWIFGPVWITLFLLMGIAAFLIWQKSGEHKDVKMALYVFGLQLVLNTFWSIIFFGWQNPYWAFIEIILLWLAIIWTFLIFYKISRVASYLLLPYIGWVSFAIYLNYTIWILNE